MLCGKSLYYGLMFSSANFRVRLTWQPCLEPDWLRPDAPPIDSVACRLPDLSWMSSFCFVSFFFSLTRRHRLSAHFFFALNIAYRIVSVVVVGYFSKRIKIGKSVRINNIQTSE